MRSNVQQAEPLIGKTEPRVFTPPRRELTPDTSHGFAVIEFAEQILEIELYPWQKWLLIHMLELNPDGTYRFKTVVVLVARQNGKSSLTQILALWGIFIAGMALVLGTAQDLDVAEEIWQGAVDMVEEIPELNALKKKVIQTNGKKSLDLKNGGRYKIRASNRRAGRSLAADMVLLDELREHQNWLAWAAITKTTMARPNSLVLCLSNAGDATSVVLDHLRKMAHAALGDPDGINLAAAEALVRDPLIEQEVAQADSDRGDALDEFDEDTMAIFEWSAPPSADKWDRDGWAQANPALGYGMVTERSLVAAARTDPDWVFKIECMCQWVDGAVTGPFPQGTWEAGIDPESTIPEENPVSYAVDTSWDRTASYIAVAGLREDFRPHVEIAARGLGQQWVVEWFEERASEQNPMRVVLQTRGSPASPLRDALLSVPWLTVVDCQGPGIGAACGVFYDRVKAAGDDEDERTVRPLAHLPQPALDLSAATAAKKPLGDVWVWDRRKSPVDSAPVMAASLAVWDALRVEPPMDTRRSAYDEADAEFVMI